MRNLIATAFLLATYGLLALAIPLLLAWCLWLALEIGACALFAWGVSNVFDLVVYLRRKGAML